MAAVLALVQDEVFQPALGQHMVCLSTIDTPCCSYDWARTVRLAVFNAGMGVLGHEYYKVLDGVRLPAAAQRCCTAAVLHSRWQLNQQGCRHSAPLAACLRAVHARPCVRTGGMAGRHRRSPTAFATALLL